MIPHDVRMVEVSKDVHLVDQLLLFLISHSAVVKFFPDEDSVV